MSKYVGALDLGTTSNRFIIFDHQGRSVGMDQKEHEQIFPKPGWVEHDPMEIWNNSVTVMRNALKKSGVAGTELSPPRDGGGTSSGASVPGMKRST